MGCSLVTLAMVRFRIYPNLGGLRLCSVWFVYCKASCTVFHELSLLIGETEITLFNSCGFERKNVHFFRVVFVCSFKKSKMARFLTMIWKGYHASLGHHGILLLGA